MIRIPASAPSISGPLGPPEVAYYPTRVAREWGVLFCTDADGQRWTLAGDTGLTEMLEAAASSSLAGLVLGGDWYGIPGWPDEWEGVDLLALLPSRS